MKRLYIYIAVGIALLIAVWFFWLRPTSASAGNGGSGTDLGVTKTGKAITEAMVKEEMNITEGYAKATIVEKAKANNRTYQEQLRLDAIYMLQNADGH